MSDENILYQPFSIERHLARFRNTYLEAILFPDGHVEYAIPSHQEKLISILQKKLGVKRQAIYDMCPEAYYFALLDWLLKETECVSLWTQFFVGDLNESQKKTVQALVDAGIYQQSVYSNSRGLWAPYSFSDSK